MFLLIELKFWLSLFWIDFCFSFLRLPWCGTHSGKKTKQEKNSFLNASQENFPNFLMKSKNNKQQLFWHLIAQFTLIRLCSVLASLLYSALTNSHFQILWNFTWNFSSTSSWRFGAYGELAEQTSVFAFEPLWNVFAEAVFCAKFFFASHYPWAGSNSREQKEE